MNGWIKLFSEFDGAQLLNVISVLESGLEIEKLHFSLTGSDSARKRIMDAELLLTLLHLRRFDT